MMRNSRTLGRSKKYPIWWLCAVVVIATVMIKSYYEASYRLLRNSTIPYHIIETNHTYHKYKVERSAAANDNKNNNITKPNFDCAINWVRIPKTASSSMHATFMKPIQDANLFASTYLFENSCVFEPGGCSAYWYDDNTTTSTITHNNPSYFGIGQRTDRSNIPNITTNLNRCFPQVRTFCYEYDKRTHTMNFGPKSKMVWTMKQGIKFDRRNTKNETISIVDKSLLSTKNVPYYITPTTSGHIALDTSLIGWILPPNPLIFAVFRNPFQRLISSFHYGISFGANRPGEVAICGGAKSKGRRQRLLRAINLARVTNDTSVYQSMLREYLTNCIDASHNAYTRFFDPLTKNLKVAMNHLESYNVIVGLQDKLEETLQRWINITLTSCYDHPEFDKLKHALVTSFEINGKKRRNENKLILGSGGNNSTTASNNEETTTASSSSSYWPNVSEFDTDLQNLIRDCIKEDEVIFKRVNELYEEQRDWYL